MICALDVLVLNLITITLSYEKEKWNSPMEQPQRLKIHLNQFILQDN